MKLRRLSLFGWLGVAMSVIAGCLFIDDELLWWMFAVSCGLSCWMAGSLGRMRVHAKRAAKSLSGNASEIHDFTEQELDALPGRPVTSIRVGCIVAAGLLVAGIVI